MAVIRPALPRLCHSARFGLLLLLKIGLAHHDDLIGANQHAIAWVHISERDCRRLGKTVSPGGTRKTFVSELTGMLTLWPASVLTVI